MSKGNQICLVLMLLLSKTILWAEIHETKENVQNMDTTIFMKSDTCDSFEIQIKSVAFSKKIKMLFLKPGRRKVINIDSVFSPDDKYILSGKTYSFGSECALSLVYMNRIKVIEHRIFKFHISFLSIIGKLTEYDHAGNKIKRCFGTKKEFFEWCSGLNLPTLTK